VGVGQLLERRQTFAIDQQLLRRLNHRIRVWWMMCAILAFAVLLGRLSAVFLFGLISFWALREFITMTPTRRGDHRALFWIFFVFTPLQYVLIALGRDAPLWLTFNRSMDLYDLYSIIIPLYASLLIPARIALAGDPKRFLERSAKIQLGLLICVYSLSYAPALLDLQLYRTDGIRWNGSNVSLLFFLVLMSQLADLFQMWGTKLAGRTAVASDINASRTWEGFFTSVVATGTVGALLTWATPFEVWEAAVMGMVISVMAFCGGMTMSAIKRDRGVNDTGTLVVGHAGVLDRLDSICFAAPVFYHLTRLFFHSVAVA
jgi:phosphatidate cytidylyltransferase